MQVRPLSPSEIARLDSVLAAHIITQTDRDWLNARIRGMSGALRKTLKTLQEKEIDLEDITD